MVYFSISFTSFPVVPISCNKTQSCRHFVYSQKAWYKQVQGKEAEEEDDEKPT
jgi:hypothetical protein